MSGSHFAIVFIHKGNTRYMGYTLTQAKHWNPDCEIILLGDEANAHYASVLGITHVPIDQFMEGAEAFRPLYRHVSTNGYAYELFCLQRWFILRDYLATRPDIGTVLYLDSDVLVYDHMPTQAKRWAAYDMTLLNKSPHTNFIKDRAVLVRFCDYISFCYTAQHSEQLLSYYLTEHYRMHGPFGGISDMTFHLYNREMHKDRVANLAIPVQGTAFDISLYTSAGFVMEPAGHIKALTWAQSKQGQQPMARLQATGEQVRLLTLHFGEGHKRFIAQFFQPKKLSLLAKVYYLLFLYFLHKLLGRKQAL